MLICTTDRLKATLLFSQLLHVCPVSGFIWTVWWKCVGVYMYVSGCAWLCAV